MGKKVDPRGIRLGIIRKHTSFGYARNAVYRNRLLQDIWVRDYLRKQLKDASVSLIEIDRSEKRVGITIHTARPGIVIGKKGEGVEVLRSALIKILKISMVHINIKEIRKPDMDAGLVARNISSQLERRVMFRRAIKRAIQSVMRTSAQGVKVLVAGRLGGAEIARSEWQKEGRVPLHTLRADVDYSASVAHTTYGVIGVKVWIFKGEIIDIESRASVA